MQGHRRRRETQRSSATSISPKGGGGTASIFLSLLLRDAHRHRVVVASRTRGRRARHKRRRIYRTRHSPAALTASYHDEQVPSLVFIAGELMKGWLNFLHDFGNVKVLIERLVL